jgi:hypothetical protein
MEDSLIDAVSVTRRTEVFVAIYGILRFTRLLLMQHYHSWRHTPALQAFANTKKWRTLKMWFYSNHTNSLSFFGEQSFTKYRGILLTTVNCVFEIFPCHISFLPYVLFTYKFCLSLYILGFLKEGLSLIYF